ncbi:MAG: NIPSNAP family protein [Chloroflexi bacterium]|nr:NIPSNAP family protein [Chloroflexota bacterium]
MIHEFRTYDLKPGSIAAYIDRVSDVIEERKKLSPLVGYFFTEVGRLNRVLHIWQYDSVEHRNEMRAKAVAGGNWPPKTQDLIEHHISVYVRNHFADGCHGPHGIGSSADDQLCADVKPGSVARILPEMLAIGHVDNREDRQRFAVIPQQVSRVPDNPYNLARPV